MMERITTKSDYPVKDVHSLSDLIGAASATTTDWKRRWFRGVIHDYPLMPKIFRDNMNYQEDYIVKSFSRMGGVFVPNLRPYDDVSVVCLAQHYGLPTRLLDWSESLTVSLYFAFDNWKSYIRKRGASSDIFIWCLNPVLLNILSEKKWLEIKKHDKSDAIGQCIEAQEDRGVFVADHNRIKHLCRFSFEDDEDIQDRDDDNLPDSLPVAFYPDFFDKRISLQQSCFTIQGRNDPALDSQLLSILGEQCDESLVCLRIPQDSVGEIAREFEVIAPKPTAILGDTEGLVKEILGQALEADDEI